MKVNTQITPHFRLVKCVCPCCKRVKVTKRFYNHMELLEKMREILGFPIYITSGYRCKNHNVEVGGSSISQHMEFATDIRPRFGNGFKQKLGVMYNMARALRFTCIIYHDSFLHIDLRRKRYFADKRKEINDEEEL